MRAIRQKLRNETRITPEAGFLPISTHHYLLYLEDLHRRLKPRTYFEIGTESGASLSFATCTSVAVDPQFRLQLDVSRNKPELHQYQGTSDDFFASGLLDRLGLKLDLAFLDGMHLFEYLLRDFINTERHMSPDGLITMHDCVPFNRLVAEREWDREKTSSWTGDVWKLVPILREYRPDLEVTVVDLAPTCLVEVRGLDPASTVLSDRFDEIVARFLPMTLDSFGLEAFRKVMSPVSPMRSDLAMPETALGTPAIVQHKRIASAWERPKKPAEASLSIAIKIGVPGPGQKLIWGDYHFARSLADGFLSLGHSVRIDSVKEWHTAEDTTDIDLVLFGSRKFKPRESIPFVGWVIYPGRNPDDLLGFSDRAQHMFFASHDAVVDHTSRYRDRSASLLLQGFDSAVMHLAGGARSEGLVFVGNNHFRNLGARPIIDMAAKAGLPLRLWGRGWEEHPIFPNLVAEYLPNAELGQLYRQAEIVLCDHMPSMREGGYVSNRIFDALACGAAVISDPIRGLPEEFRDYVHLCNSPDELTAAVADIRAEGAVKRDQRRAFAAEMRKRHSLQFRASEILSVLSGLKARKERAGSA